MGIFGAAHGSGGGRGQGGGGQKNSLFPKLCHISNNDEAWHSYTLIKEDSKNI